jgi:glutamate synthase (NADPH/NADH) small chain
MAKDVKAFLKTKRETASYRRVDERVKDYEEVFVMRGADQTKGQAHRCMECGTPFCHWGCPLGNYIPEWNGFAAQGRWREAYDLLASTNNFPEFTGRICPAFCESACVLGLNDEPVTCRENELGIIEMAFESGYVQARPPARRTGRKVAVVGSGPAGLAAADQLNKAGHSVTLFERDDRLGGWLRYGIPDFKLDKKVIDRRIDIMRLEGVEFKIGTYVGRDFAVENLLKNYDALLLTGGSRVPRDLQVPGRGLKGIYFAGDYLTQSNRRVAGDDISTTVEITAKGKNVVVIGGGDTGSDCVGTANRQGAFSVVQIEVMPQPPAVRDQSCPWPGYPMLLKTTSSHEEGVNRHWCVLTKEFVGDRKGNVEKIRCAKVEFVAEEGASRPVMKEIPDSEFDIPADLVILAVGFLHPEHNGLLDCLGISYDQRGNVKTGDDMMTGVKGVFSAGDMRTGQSLVMKCIAEGRRAAHYIDKYLMGESVLPVV